MIKTELSRSDLKARISSVRMHMSSGDFAAAFGCADEVVAGVPHEPKGWILKAQALVALHRINDALDTLREALRVQPDDRKLLAQARAIAFANGRFAEASRYSLRLLNIAPEDKKNHRILTQCWMASGQFEKVAEFLQGRGPLADQPRFGKHAYHLYYQRVKEAAPELLAGWRYAVENEVEAPVTSPPPEQPATLIQYWSQGVPPEDVQLVASAWRQLLAREQIGEIELFDRNTAEAWIAENAPEFSVHFSQAFHFAMEADIFRIAFASKRPCVYVDIDAWPLENAAEIVKFGLRQHRSMLYLRSYIPWLGNGFFISTPTCPFFRELVSQCLAINLGEWVADRDTILKTFGPIRYNDVLLQLIERSCTSKVSPIEGVPGCSKLMLEDGEILFTHEAAVASMKPPFRLNYKATEASWKRKDQ